MKTGIRILSGLLLFGCGQMAPQNPLTPGMPPAPATASCPARMNFEAPGSLGLWTAPNWAAGNVAGWPQRVNNQAACGQWSMQTQMNVTNMLGTYSGNNAILFSVLPKAENFDGKTLSVYVYFSQNPNGTPSQAPPGDLGVTLQFEDLNQNWVPATNQPFLGLKAGWNHLQRYFYGTEVQSIQALNIQVSTANGVSYAGYMWVDEITW